MREAAIEEMLSGLTPRERSLVRDAAVMGHVLGSMWGRAHFPSAPEDRYPKDGDVYRSVLYAVSRDENYKVLKGEFDAYEGI